MLGVYIQVKSSDYLTAAVGSPELVETTAQPAGVVDGEAACL